jgi:PAS domain S-box-containing protein
MELEEIESNRNLVEDALRESETQFRMILNSLGDAIHVINKNMKILMMNTSFQRWNLELGLEVDVIGKHLFEVFQFLPESIKDEYTQVFNTGEKLITEENTEIGEQEFVTETRKIPIYENGEVSQVITIIRDITGRKRSDEALKESEERFRGIAEESFDIIFIINIEGRLNYISPSVNKVTGYLREELIDNTLEKFLPESQLKRIKQAGEILLKGETIEGLELEILGKKKNIVFLEINATPMYKNDVIVGYQGIARDITERKRTEEEMKKRLMKFKLEQGKVYSIEESSHTISNEVLKDLIKVGYSGLVFSRSYDSHFKDKYEGVLDFLWLSENGRKNAIRPNLGEIIAKISNLPHKKVIYIDRLDYLISKKGFKKVLEFTQNLIEVAIFSNHIIILSIDPSILNQRELRLFEKETNQIIPMFTPKLPEDLINILRFVYEQNISGLKPTYSEVEHELKVCKPTMRKRIRQLIGSGFIIDNMKGRSKIVELTDRGKNVFLK